MSTLSDILKRILKTSTFSHRTIV